MTIDTSKVLKIEKSISKLNRLILFGLVILLISVWLINGGAIETRRGELTIYFGWLGLVFIAPTILVSFVRAYILGDTVIVLAPSGLTFRYASANEILWLHIVKISEGVNARAPYIRLEIQEEDLKKLGFTKSFQITRFLYKIFFLEKWNLLVVR